MNANSTSEGRNNKASPESDNNGPEVDDDPDMESDVFETPSVNYLSQPLSKYAYLKATVAA